MSPHKKFYEQYENIGGLTDEQLVEAIKEIEMRAIGGDEATGGSSLREMNDARYQALSDEQYRRDKAMNKAWNEFKKIGVSESDGMGTGIGVNGGFGLNEEMERNDNKNMPQNIQNEKGMKRKVVGNEGYTDIDTPHTDSFYLPGKVKDEEADASDKTEGKQELSSDNKVRKKQPFNTGMTAQATIG